MRKSGSNEIIFKGREKQWFYWKKMQITLSGEMKIVK